jgi:DNA-directed RNA polymerase subunit RPC12/RpoP
MIFFGSKGKTISGHVVEGIQCPSCESKQFITFGLLKYFHLYWVPTFVTSRSAGLECTHCKKILIGKELPEDLSKKIKQTVFNKKNTLPMFSGLIIIACLAMFMTYLAQEGNKREAVYIEQPLAGDIYTVDFTKIFTDTDTEYRYGSMRIKAIQSGEAELQVSKIAYNKRSGVRKDITKDKTSLDSYYEDDTMYVDLADLKQMKESGAIKNITR